MAAHSSHCRRRRRTQNRTLKDEGCGMSHVFISYAREDASVVVELAAAIERLDYQTWYFDRDGLPGIPYLPQVTEAITDATAFVMLLERSA
jgi:TIR domain